MAISLELTRLMNNIRNHVPGAIDSAIQLELFNTLDDFLQQTNFWQEEIEYTVRAARTEYEVVGTEDGQVISLLSNVNSTGGDVPATMLSIGTLVLENEPSQTEVYTATVAYTVVDPVDSNGYPLLPDGLLLKYSTGIQDGVVGRMMSQPAKPYTNERMGIFNLRKYQAAVANARAAVLHQNLHGAQAWTFPQFAAGSQR